MTHPERALLVVEDSPDDELLTLTAIGRCGVPCRVDVIRHGGEVLSALHAPGAPAPDLIVLDFHLPGLNGLEILRGIRKHEGTRRVPVVMFSARSTQEQVEECLGEGANSCVEKPMAVSLYLDHVGQMARYWLTVDRRPPRES